MAQKNKNALSAGSLVQEYLIQDVLGQGGFGITYLAFDQKLERKLAIKEYFPWEFAVRTDHGRVEFSHAESESLFDWGLDRFLEEGKMLAKFNHPNIVRVLNYLETNNTAYIVMEFEEGEELSASIKLRSTVSESKVLNIFLPILDGLKRVHAEGVIHRDIKPANILLLKNDTPLLIDFGSARQSIGVKTKTLTTLVSPGYAPFEQYANEAGSKQGPWTDIYSLSASMYRCLFGSCPEDAISRAKSVLDGHPDPYIKASELGDGSISKELLHTIDMGLSFKAIDRPQTIEEWLIYFPQIRNTEEQEYLPTQRIESHTDPVNSETHVLQEPGERLAITKYLVFGMLSLWAYTSYSLVGKLTKLLQKKNKALIYIFPGIYLLSIVLVASWLVPNLFLGYVQAEDVALKIILLSAVIYYLNTTAFVLWVMACLKKYDFKNNVKNEKKNKLIEKWESIDNKTALFLIISCPIIVSPYFGVKIYFEDTSTIFSMIMPLIILIFGGVFHVWGTRHLVDSINLVVTKVGQSTK